VDECSSGGAGRAESKLIFKQVREIGVGKDWIKKDLTILFFMILARIGVIEIGL